MLRETGRIVRVEPDALWVETLQKSVCGSCSAQKGCGQHALAKTLATSSMIRVLLNGRYAPSFQLDQQVAIGIPEDVVVKGSLLIYMLPLLLLLASGAVGYRLTASDGVAALAALLGLVAGGCLVRWYSDLTRGDPRRQPILLDLER